MDLLSDVLSLLKPRGYLAGGFAVDGDMAIRWPKHQGIKCYAILSGRLHLAEGTRGGVGWLFALADKQMSAAITCMHDDPGHPWTLQKLAERVGMSRSIFALRFKETVGDTPMEYLTRWRMLLAGDRLKNSDDSISAIALSLGYESESAFGKAFKRVMGCSPRQHSRGSSLALPPSITTETGYGDQPELARAVQDEQLSQEIAERSKKP